MSNLFNMFTDRNAERQERYQTGLREGLAEGKDIGRTETRNNIRDAVDNSRLSDRITRNRLNSYLDESTR